MEKFFNTEGPIKPDLHYQVAPLQRWDLEEILLLINQQKYFVLHAPRQTGKTTCLLALMEYLNRQHQYTCIYANLEPAQAMRDHVVEAERTLCGAILEAMKPIINAETRALLTASSATAQIGMRVFGLLAEWSRLSDKALILLLDEVDALVGDTLISLLRQLRAGYAQRPCAFPQSIILCGVRDVRDYRMQYANQQVITGGSAFNIKAESLRLGNFQFAEIHQLYTQHQQLTGQRLEEGCIDYLFDQTNGQPWLVNALGYQVCFRHKPNRDRSRSISIADLAQAREVLIESRAVHLDQLADKLKEPHVHRIIEPILASDAMDIDLIPSDDLQYAIDLGLVIMQNQKVMIANPIYREVIPRSLNIRER